MSTERSQAGQRKSKPRQRRSPSVEESHGSRGSDTRYPDDGFSSASASIHANQRSLTGGPAQGQMSQGRMAPSSSSKCSNHDSGSVHVDSAIDNKIHSCSSQNVPQSTEKNRRTERKTLKDSQFKSTEDISNYRSSMSQKDGLDASSRSVNGCFAGGGQREEDFEEVSSKKTLQHPEYSHGIFDICLPQQKGLVKLAPSFLTMNKEMRKDRNGKRNDGLRPGMIHMKKYIDLSNQVEIIKKCRDLGVGRGGFYQPGYSDGAKLHLWMMCLGKNWDPETRLYGDRRPTDDAEPPLIPESFNELVERAIKDAHAFMEKNSNIKPVESVLPIMKPNICIVNFYTNNGKLGLHQDRDESPESLDKGLPVVSFSRGDSAEFLYGDTRDPDAAKKVILESGDVLIFGGKSRHIFHGVPSICPGTAPRFPVGETKLRPGRLNLTFRQY